MTYKAYRNTIYSDGLIMANTSNQYLGIDPTCTDGDLLRMVNGDAQVKMLSGGLGINLANGSGGFFPASPLALIARVTYANSKYAPTELYNPLNKSIEISLSSNLFKLTHNLGTTAYTCVGTCVYPDSTRIPVVHFTAYNENNVTFYIRFSSNSSTYVNTGWTCVDIFFYQYTAIG